MRKYQLQIVCSYPLLLETPMGKQFPGQNTKLFLGPQKMDPFMSVF